MRRKTGAAMANRKKMKIFVLFYLFFFHARWPAGWPCFVVVVWAVAREEAGWRRQQDGLALLWFCGLWQGRRQAAAWPCFVVVL